MELTGLKIWISKNASLLVDVALELKYAIETNLS